MADNRQDPASILLAQSIAAGFALSAYGFGLTARMFGMMSEMFAVATGAGMEPSATANTPENRESSAAPKTSAKVLSFERAEKAKSSKSAVALPTAPEDLKVISGIGPKLEQLLNGLGISTLSQIAKWSSDEAARIDGEFKLNGRILRDDWAGQAKKMAGG